MEDGGYLFFVHQKIPSVFNVTSIKFYLNNEGTELKIIKKHSFHENGDKMAVPKFQKERHAANTVKGKGGKGQT